MPFNMLKINSLRDYALIFILSFSAQITLAQTDGEKTSVKMEAIAPPSDPPNRYAVLEEAVRRLATDTVLKRGQVGIVVVDVTTGQTLAAHNAEMSLIPASNMKIVSTAAGLSILGNDYRFKTELQYDGYLRDSVLYGNLYIKGSGDPTLGSPNMDSVPRWQAILDTFALKTKQLGISVVIGKIIGDGSVFDENTAIPTWLWEDLGNYYGAGPNGLTFHENYYDLAFRRSSDINASPAIEGLEPRIPDFKLDNQVKSVKGGSESAYIYTVPYAREGIVAGTIPIGNRNDTIAGTMPDPPYTLAWHLRRRLQDFGVAVMDSAMSQTQWRKISATAPPRRSFFTWESPTLSKIVEHANLESNNLYCESIVNAIALQKTGFGTTDNGTAAIKDFWQSKGINTEGLFMQDGSGLSPRNGVTPMQLAHMLCTVALDSLWFSVFYQSLPTAAQTSTGTFRRMFRNTPSVWGRLKAKSGTISRVKSYSGYMTTLDGRLLAFSAMCNNFTCSSREITKRLEQFMVDIGQF
jgi:serine-type D-Ala-D-Ala carboxypeptidase/endopeptidase (penicillin-binding protein 4)